ncbi:MAG TPA: helix-turn-helix domain-containing protein [Acidimicrobiales bacterium]|nr:helix-turn-helix domain-containing protein [Acidimicrobiales bacterium]
MLHHGDSWVDLSPVESRLMSELLTRFGEPVATDDLVHAVWGSGRPRSGNLRVHILRLRRRIAPLGLRIHSLPGRGYLLSWSPAGEAP